MQTFKPSDPKSNVNLVRAIALTEHFKELTVSSAKDLAKETGMTVGECKRLLAFGESHGVLFFDYATNAWRCT